MKNIQCAILFSDKKVSLSFRAMITISNFMHFMGMKIKKALAESMIVWLVFIFSVTIKTIRSISLISLYTFHEKRLRH